MDTTLSQRVSKKIDVTEKVLGYIIEDLHNQRLPRKIRYHYSVTDDNIKLVMKEFKIFYLPFEK